MQVELPLLFGFSGIEYLFPSLYFEAVCFLTTEVSLL